MSLDLIQKQTNFIMKIIMAEQIVSLNEKMFCDSKYDLDKKKQLFLGNNKI